MHLMGSGSISNAGPAALGAGIEPKCSMPRVAAAAPDFVEVSPLMRSCIFGFNTHVAELPSSATDVRGGGASGAPCDPLHVAETTVRRAFLSQLPHDLLGGASCNDSVEDKPSSEVLLEVAPLWASSSTREGESGPLLPLNLRMRLAALSHASNRREEHKDSRFCGRSTTWRRGRQARKLKAGLRSGSGLCPLELPRVAADNDSAQRATPASMTPAAVTAQLPALGSGSGDSVVAKDAHSTGGQDDGSEPDSSALLQVLSLEVDTLTEVSLNRFLELLCFVVVDLLSMPSDSTSRRGKELCGLLWLWGFFAEC